MKQPGLAGKIVKYHPLSGFGGFRPLAILEKNNNRLLTECEGGTGEYWPSVEAVRTSLRSVRSATTEGQYSPVRPSHSVSKLFIIWHSVISDSKMHFRWLALKGFRRDVFLMTRTTQTKASYHEFEKQILKASKISLNKTSKTLLTESDKGNC